MKEAMLNIPQLLADELSLRPSQVQNALELFAMGATVPFIARFRKERTGEMNEVDLRNLLDRHTYLTELEERKAAILQSIAAQGKLTDELKAKIESCLQKTELEDLYLPYKPKRRTRATIAREKGLEGLAEWIKSLNRPEVTAANLEEEAQRYLSGEKDVKTAADALQGASDILAEEVSEKAEMRAYLRNYFLQEGLFVSRIKEEFPKGTTKFEMYRDYKAKVQDIAPHNMLALRRGEAEGVLRLTLELDETVVMAYLASKELLRYAAGITPSVAKNIVAYRNEHGAFRNRQELTRVPKFGPKTFEQAAGFLRIRGGDNPLDNSAVHPESYFVVEAIAKDLGVPLQRITQIPDKIRSLDLRKYVSAKVGEPTLRDIIAELQKPGRGPRAEFRYASFQEGIKEIKDLRVGMVLEGVVTNVTNFGAFVDIGVHQDGLVHISQLADRFVDDPKKVVKVGQVGQVRVLEVNEPLRRISLSMKSPGPAKPKRENGPHRREERTPTIEDLKAKFRRN